MREIKFRGKRIDNGQWEYGYLYRDEFKTFILKETIVQIAPNTVNGPAEYDNETEWIEVRPETIGQYIRNGYEDNKEIYEEDIVILEERGEDEVMPVGIVCYEEDEFVVNYNSYIYCLEYKYGNFDIKNLRKYHNGYHQRSVSEIIEVVGNIYENPDICKK